MPGKGSGGCALTFRRLCKKTTSEYFAGFSISNRLFALAHVSPLDNSICLLLAFSAGIMM